MSRKEPTFGQLVSYMSSEKSNDDFDIFHHCYARSENDLVREFTQNSELLSKRANGNYLYHEIISLSVAEGVTRNEIRESLRDIAETYIGSRCPNNMVYGCLHEDHDTHLHYHLMISANEMGGSKRIRLSKRNFEAVKQGLEDHVLSQYPNLKQTKLQGVDSPVEKYSLKAGEMKRRMGELPSRDEVRDVLSVAMLQSSSMDGFCRFLADQGYDFYTRGKNFGVKVEQENGSTKSYRFSTMGLHEDFEKFQSQLSTHKPTEARKAETDKSNPEPLQTSPQRAEENEKMQNAAEADKQVKKKNRRSADEKEKQGQKPTNRESVDVGKKSKDDVRKKRRQERFTEPTTKQQPRTKTQQPLKSENVEPKPTPKDQEIDRLEREFQKMNGKKSSSQKDNKKHSQ